MRLDGYRAVLGQRDARRILLLGVFVRVPLWAGAVVLTLHAVTTLGRSYGAAGALAGVEAVALSVSNPWRGRLLDRIGLRRTLAPSLVVLTICWSVAPFLSYWPLLAFVTIAGLFAVPTFSVVRQAVMHAVPDEHRTAALSLDAVLVEVSFMIGPPIGVLLATAYPTTWALLATQFAAILGGAAIWLANPPLRAERGAAAEAAGERTGMRSWLTPPVAAVLLMSAAAVLVLGATDVSIVAALREMDHQSWIGWELAVWGLGSAVGGLTYGALHRTVPVPVLLGLLAAATLPVALAREPVLLAILLFVAGAFCAPTLTATVDTLSRLVSEHVRGEALGWHAAAMTAGIAVGSPAAGLAIDRLGWQGGFLLSGAVGAAAAIGGAATMRAGPVGACGRSAADPAVVGQLR